MVRDRQRGLMNIAVLVPSYRRPELLKFTLSSWLRAKGVRYVVVIADSPYDEELFLYEKVLAEMKQRYSYIEIIYELFRGKRGSTVARNRLLEIASELNTGFVVMIDDDYVLPNPFFLTAMTAWFRNSNVGAVGGRVVNIVRRTVDPDFFLNSFISVADALTRISGFIFLDTLNGPRYAEFLTPFYMLRRDLIDKVRYDPIYGGTAYREESDVHMQIKRLGYKLILDPRVYVLHLGLNEGGNRPPISMAQRIYWKARNHAIFVAKHFSSTSVRLWYLLTSALILSLYRPWHIFQLLKGLSDGLKLYRKSSSSRALRTLKNL